MANLSTFERLRPVGRLEKHATARHSLGFYNNVATSAFYLRSTGLSVVDLRSLVYRALVGVIASHPALSVLVVDEDTPSPYFMRLPEIDLDKTVRFQASQIVQDGSQADAITEFDQILEEEHNRNFKPLDGRRPMWRLLITHDGSEPCSRFIATFVFHHAICDGTSGLVFHRSFLSELAKVALTTLRSTEESIAKCSEHDLLPCLEDLHPLPISLRYLAKSAWQEFLARRPSNLWPPGPITDVASKGRTHFQSLYFSQDTTSRLVRVCRSHQTTVTAATQAMLAAVILSELPSETSPILRVDGAVSLRRWLSTTMVDEDKIGTWVSRYLTEHRLPQGKCPRTTISATELFSWKEAQRVRAIIETEMRNKGKDSHVALLRFAGNLHDFFRGKIGKPRDESFEFTNIGVFKSGQNESDKTEWAIGKVVFSQSADVAGAALEASLVTGADGCLNIGFSWLDSVVEGDWVHQVMRSMKKLVEQQGSML